jgi:hypothetical protein
VKSIAGRRILFIGIGFYDYEEQIVSRLRARGAELIASSDRPPILQGAIAGLVNRVPALARALVRRHEQALLRQAAKVSLDQVLIIKAVDLSVEFLRELRRLQPRAQFVLYQWDSIARLPGLAERLPFFDRVLTFDRPDATANPQWKFRPLFYREPGSGSVSEDIDVSFIGWLHSDRLAGVRRMQQQARQQGLNTYVYLYTGIVTWLKLLMRGEARDVHPKPISYSKVREINLRSRCVLDLPHAAQTGLTMRAIETLGFRKKLITSGADIVNYDFYRAENVKVIAPGDWNIEPTFVRSPAAPVPEATRQRYSLDAWLTDVLGLEDEVAARSVEPATSAVLN